MPRRRAGLPHFPSRQPLPTEPGSRILITEILGRVMASIRAALGASQQEVAALTGAPTSTVSKLERAETAMSAFDLVAFAAAFNEIQRTLGVPVQRRLEGWEFLRVATTIAGSLVDEGYCTLWPGAGTDLDPQYYVTGRRLDLLVRQHWPEEYRWLL